MVHFRKYGLLVVMYMCAFCMPSRAQNNLRDRNNLDYFIAASTRSSPLIKDFSNQLLINKIDSIRIQARYRPQVTASSSGLYAPVVNGYGFDEVMTNGQSLDALISVDYDLTRNGMRTTQSRGMQLQRDSINYALDLSRLDLQKAVTEQYIITYDSQQQVAFNLDVYNLLKKEDFLLKALTRSNVYKQTEYLTFLVIFKQHQLLYKQAELQWRANLSMLNYMSGLKDTTAIILAEPVLNLSPDGQEPRVFFTKRFSIDSLSAINDKKAIDIFYKPKLGVYVNGGYNSSLVLQPYKNFGTSIGFTVSVPIYDGHQKKMLLDKVDLQAQTASSYRNFFVRQQDQQIVMLRQQIADTQGLYQQIIGQIEFARGLIDVDRKLLRTGDVRIADFVIAVNNYMAAQNVLRQTNIDRLKLISQLNYWNR